MHLSPEELTGYRDHSLAPEEILRIGLHCEQCPECRQKLAADADGAGALRALLSEEPDEQELVLLAAGRLPEARAREIEEHAAGCPRCAETIAELRQMAPHPAEAPVIEMPKRRGLPAWAWAAAAAGVAAVGIGMYQRQQQPVLLASLHDGAALATLNDAGQLAGLSNLDAEERGWIAEAMRSGHLAVGATIDPGQSTVLRGEASGASFRLLTPVDRRLADDAPEFRWEALAGASAYEVTVFTADDTIVAQGESSGMSWRPAAPLPREVRLGWQVTARTGGQRVLAPAPPAPPVYFEVIAPDLAARIDRARGSHLQLAVLYARAGMAEEASAELAALSAENPGSTVITGWRGSLAVR